MGEKRGWAINRGSSAHRADQSGGAWAPASARAVLGAVRAALSGSLTSVVEVGCGRGDWLAAWSAWGVSRVRGVDGAYVDPAAMAVDPEVCTSADLTRPVDLGERFDLVVSLEVAEHLRRDASGTFAATLARHGDVVLFSAAVPGQGGDGHINERPLGFWRDTFAGLGYGCFDCIRPALAGAAEVAACYRYNALLYVKHGAEGRLTEAARGARIPDGGRVADVSSTPWRVRRAVLRPLPAPVVTALAVGTQRLGWMPPAR